ncbi:MAG: outer membrane protein [Xanthobacteraceae bacterium]
MRTFLIGTPILLGMMASAAAADLPVYTPPIYNWTGSYVGANAGWVGSADNTITLTGTDTGTGGLGTSLLNGVIPSSIDLGYSGFLGGGQLGYNWQAGSWVFGLEGDIDWVNAKGSVVVPDVAAIVGLKTPLTTNAARELDWLGTFRGRIGITLGGASSGPAPVYTKAPPAPAALLLLYVTGGLAVGQHQLGIGVVAPNSSPPANLFSETSTTSAGWTVGAGAEWMFAPSWSLKAEYLYVDLGGISSTIFYAYPVGQTSSLTATANDRLNIVRGGINYHF